LWKEGRDDYRVADIYGFSCLYPRHVGDSNRGKDGWAAKSPGWRIEKGWVMKLTGGRPLTGYHVFMTVFLVA